MRLTVLAAILCVLLGACQTSGGGYSQGAGVENNGHNHGGEGGGGR
jgi:hypothetical protein